MKKVRKTRVSKPKERLTPEKVKEIVAILDGWTGKLTWDALRDELEQRWHYTYSRVSLPKHDRVKQAFQLCKERLRKSPAPPGGGDVHFQAALERIGVLKAENERLNLEITHLQQQFVIWAYKPNLAGLDEQGLNKPMYRIERRKSCDPGTSK
ncbi:MAG: hypothetical protein WCP06_07425 [Verrucomicrobiota bacterium]